MTFTQAAAGPLVALGALIFLGASAPASAQAPSQAQIAAVRSSCRSDFLANCSGVQPGGKDALACLRRNLGKLSLSCKTAVSAITPAAPAATTPQRAPARPAAARPAPAAAPSPASVAAPPPVPVRPQRSTNAMAPKTRSAVEPRAASATQTDAIRQSCRADFLAHCAGVTPGGKQALTCLQRNVGRLSSRCRSAVVATMRKPSVAAHPVNAEHAAAAAPLRPHPPAVAPLRLRPFIMPQRRVVIVTICGSDTRRLCAGTLPGGERILKCLAAQPALLSPRCYAALKRVSRD